MRDIKFRCHIKGRKKLVYNFTLESVDVSVSDDGRNTLMQYTGLQDKNGTDIYEGDIILIANKSYKEKATVEWSVRGAKWVLVYNDLSVYELATWTETVYEVIGNIYENPELIETR